MTQSPPSGSLTLIDVGTTRIKAAIALPFDDGHHLCAQISRPSLLPDDEDIATAEALAELEQLTGWRVTAGAPTAASRTVVSTSAGNPLRIAAVTAADKDLKPLVSRLESRGYVQTPAAICVLPGKGNGAAALAQTIETLRQSPCDAIAVSVSNRRDVPAVAAMLETVHPGSDQTTPRVLFAGPADAVAGLTERLQGTYALDHIGGDWTESALPDAKLDAALEQFRAPITAVDLGLPIRGQVEPSVDGPLSWDRLSPVMAGAFQGTVCIVDVGGSKTAVSVASPTGDGKPAGPTATSQAALGTAGGLDDLLRFVDIDLVRAWLPFDISQDALRDYLANRRLLRGGIVSDNRQLMIDQAVARVCGLAARKMETRPDFLIATGGIATYPRIAQSVLTLLDIVQPLSPCRILVDRAGLLPRLGPLLRVDPEAALSLLKSDTFINCGVCLSLQGRLKPGEAIAEIGIQRTGASRVGETPEEVHTIRFGTITRIPLGPAEQAGIRVTTARRNSFGIELADRPWARRSAQLPGSEPDTIAGGLLGLIIDARGRPIDLPEDATNRQARLIEWLAAVNAFDADVFSGMD